MTLSIQDLKELVWSLMATLRGHVDSTKIKEYLLKLLFFKRICDKFDEDKSYLENDENLTKLEFYVPVEARIGIIVNNRRNISSAIEKAFQILEDNNPQLRNTLTGFIDLKGIDDDIIKKLLEILTRPHFNLANSNLEHPDLLGKLFRFVLDELAQSEGKIEGDYYTPIYIVKLLVRILAPQEGMSIYDPACGTCGMLIECAEFIRESGKDSSNLSMYGQEINLNIRALALLNLFANNIKNVKIESGNTLLNPKFVINGKLKTFDIALANPPWNQINWGREFFLKADPYERAEFGIPSNLSADWIWVQHMLKSLDDGGRMGVLLSDKPLISGQIEKDIRKAIIECDLIESVISLPSNSFYNTSIPVNILIINKFKSEDLKNKIFFVKIEKYLKKGDKIAHFSDSNIKRILEIYKLKKEVQNFSKIIDLEEIKKNDYNLKTNSYVNEIQILAKHLDFKETAFGNVVKEINLANKDNEEGFHTKSNCIYIPLLGRSKVYSNLEDLHLKPHNYAQIVFNPEKVLAEFAEGFYNSQLGLMIREQMKSGITIPKISKKNLKNSRIYLPEFDIQKEFIEVIQTIQNVKIQLNDIESKLWSYPKSVKMIKKRIAKFYQQENFNEWMETLPFPLSSILRLFVSRKYANPKDKVEHLLHFFEALSLFISNIMISAFYSDDQFFNENKDYLFADETRDGLISFERTSFGLWVRIAERSAKLTRRLLSSKKIEDRNLCLALFKLKSQDFIEKLNKKKIVEILNNTNKYRNDWHGHGGIFSEKDNETHLLLLQKELHRFRESIKEVFSDIFLIMPISMNYLSGIYNNRVYLLMGSHNIFDEIEISTSIPLENDKIYMIEKNNLLPLELLPLFKILSSPEEAKNACYFYNKVERGVFKWKTYHFTGISPKIEKDFNLESFFKEF